MSPSNGMQRIVNRILRHAAVDGLEIGQNEPIEFTPPTDNPLRDRYPEINVEALTDDEQLWLSTLYKSSNRFKSGKAERIAMHNYILRTFYKWDYSKITSVTQGLRAKGIVVQTASGYKLNLSGEEPTTTKKKKKAQSNGSYKPGTTCAFCKRKLTMENATFDHVIPKSRGGGEGSNLVRACFDCNQMKGDRTPHEWANDILTYRKPNRKDSLPSWRFRAIVQLRIWLILALGAAQ